MAQHFIRDSEGRIEKILNDQEYAEYQKLGCFGKTIIYIFVGIVAIIFFISQCDDPKEMESKGTPSSQVSNSMSSSTGEIQTGTGSLMEEEQVLAPTIVEAASDMQEELTTSIPDVEEMPDEESQSERKLSRKERRALRKAQREEEQAIDE